MTDVAEASAQSLLGGGRFAVVTGKEWAGAEALVTAAAAHVVAPGPSTRLAIATGVGLGGHRGVAVIEELPPGPPPDSKTLAFTTVAAAGVRALQAGWSLVQPWAPQDVAPL